MSEGNTVDLSILIVHTYEGEMLRQTLKGIRRAAPSISYEVIIIDNNPAAGFYGVLQEEFPEARYVANDHNKGFGGAMNEGMRIAKGTYTLVFNPDIIVKPGSLEALKTFMDAHTDVGIVGPKLENPDGTLQHSTYRLPTWLTPVYRRTPLGSLSFGRNVLDTYFMKDVSHDEIIDVDAMIGAALFCRTSALKEVGFFDERFFLYYEDNDLCRRFWEAGWRVVYNPQAVLMHYHRRATADGGLFKQITSKGTWIQISSFLKYMRKYAGASNPKDVYLQQHGPISPST